MQSVLQNKSLITNLISLAFVVVGLSSIQFNETFLNVGLFALSGALTNWIAIHMLFEKVPGFYGSGVIQLRFEAFKQAIKSMMMHEFFNADKIQKLMTANEISLESTSALTDKIDLNKAFGLLVEAIESSSFGGLLAMVGGTAALEPLRAPMIQKMQTFIQEEVLVHQSELISSVMSPQLIINKVEQLVDNRLNELTPKMVKTLVSNLIHEHLGWLVIWGGVFGGLIGLAKEIIISII